jgi:hypothetical protein
MGIPFSKKCIFLFENKNKYLDDDVAKLLTYQCIDNLYKADCLFELYQEKHIEYFGYTPANKIKNLNVLYRENPYLHPLFMKGDVLFMSQLEKIVVQSFMNEQATELWMQIINCGYEFLNLSIPETNNKKIKGKGDLATDNKDENNHSVITIDVPDFYINYEYYILANDLISLDPPCLPLGIYIKNPSFYRINRLSNNYVESPIISKSDFTKEVKVSPMSVLKTESEHLKNHKYMTREDTPSPMETISLKDSTGMDYEQECSDKLNHLKKLSSNNKAVLDVLDLNQPQLPLFITNPLPGFILRENTKIQLLVHTKSNQPLLRSSKSIAQKVTNEKNEVFEKEKLELLEKSERFHDIHDKLKERYDKYYFEIINSIDEGITLDD